MYLNPNYLQVPPKQNEIGNYTSQPRSNYQAKIADEYGMGQTPKRYILKMNSPTHQQGSKHIKGKFSLRTSSQRVPMRNRQPGLFQKPHGQKKSYDMNSIDDSKEEHSTVQQSEIEKLRETVRFLSKKLYEKTQRNKTMNTPSNEKMLMKEVIWLKKALHDEQIRNEALSQQIAQGKNMRGGLSSSRTKTESTNKPVFANEQSKKQNQSLNEFEQIHFNLSNITKIQQEMSGLKKDVTQLKQVIIDQRLYISELEIEIQVLKQVQLIGNKQPGWSNLMRKIEEEQKHTKFSQRRSSMGSINEAIEQQ